MKSYSVLYSIQHLNRLQRYRYLFITAILTFSDLHITYFWVRTWLFQLQNTILWYVRYRILGWRSSCLSYYNILSYVRHDNEEKRKKRLPSMKKGVSLQRREAFFKTKKASSLLVSISHFFPI